MMEKRFEPDFVLFAVTLILLGMGTIMVYSSSMHLAEQRFGSDSFFLVRHVVRVLLGFAVMFIVAKIDYHVWGRLSLPFLFLAVLLLIVVLIPSLPFTAGEVKGANRWLHWGPLTLQPSEVVKLALVIYLAHSLARRQHYMHAFRKGFLPSFVILCVVCGLILLQPDYGIAITLFTMGLILLFVGKAQIRHLVMLGLTTVPLLGVLIYLDPNRLKRILVISKWGSDVLGVEYQARQSLISLGSGGLWGLGLGQGRQKLLYLPDAHTDFVFSIIGEELGFLGTMVVMALFLVFLWRGIRAARSAPDLFGFFLAFGISFMVFSIGLIHVGVACAVLPTTGMPLPFISYGGSSILLTLTGVGILLNISKQSGVE